MALRRYRHGMHHTWLSTLRFGDLMPIFCQEVTPGDSWEGASHGIIRFAPLNYPAFVQGRINVFFFFSPHRLVDDEFEDRVTGVSAAAWPQRTVSQATYTTDEVYRAFGLGEPEAAGSYNVYRNPIAHYYNVWNEYFRDQELEAITGIHGTTNLVQVRQSKGDYYGQARDVIQQGTEETVDTSGPTLGVTAIRNAFHRQKFKERRSQFGERYFDLLASYGLRVPASRLDRPEFCCRSRGIIGISEVLATATSASENTGDFKGHGIAGITVPFPRRVFVEHGTLLGLVCIRPRQTMQDAMDRMYATADKNDLWQPELAQDTQVAMRMHEVWSGAPAANFNDVLGYQARDNWLRYGRDTIAGEMAQTANDSWHVARQFSAAPSLINIASVPHNTRIYQDASSVHMFMFWSHRISKTSLVGRRPK